jgi:hypothetical protein
VVYNGAGAIAQSQSTVLPVVIAPQYKEQKENKVAKCAILLPLYGIVH